MKILKLNSDSTEREDFACVHGPLDGEVISLPYGSTTTAVFTHKGEKGRYIMLPEHLTGKEGVRNTPVSCTLYWEPAYDERSTRKTRSTKRRSRKLQS